MSAVDVWEDRLQQAHASYPAATVPVTAVDMARVVNGEEILVRLLRNVLAVDNVAVRRGQRDIVDVEEGRQLLAELRGQDYTVEPFHDALRALNGPRSLENLKRRTGMSKANLSRLMTAQKTPRVDEMETVAAAFGKRPMYFAEYRAATFAAIVQAQLTADPDRSAALAHHFGIGR